LRELQIKVLGKNGFIKWYKEQLSNLRGVWNEKRCKQPWAIPVGVIVGLFVIGGGLGGLGKYLNKKKDTGLRDYSNQPNLNTSIWDAFPKQKKYYEDSDSTNEHKGLSYDDEGLGKGVKKSRRKKKSLVRGSKKRR
jgi:hypothetical protein